MHKTLKDIPVKITHGTFREGICVAQIFINFRSIKFMIICLIHWHTQFSSRYIAKCINKRHFRYIFFFFKTYLLIAECFVMRPMAAYSSGALRQNSTQSLLNFPFQVIFSSSFMSLCLLFILVFTFIFIA